MKFITKTAWAAAIAVALTGTTWATTMQGKTQQQSSKQHQANRPEAVGEKTNLTAGERNFLQSAAEINASEVQLGKIALQKSQDPKIRQIAEHLVSDHTKANQELQKLASDKGVSLTMQPNHREQRRLSRLESKSGSEFNKAFLRQNIIGHERAISLFEAVSRRAQDPDIKSWSGKMVPGLQDHLAMARSASPEAVAERGQGWQKGKHQMKSQQPSGAASPSGIMSPSPSGAASPSGY
ncbi:MAG: DUF4142 domain-containing protein [Verrucomicrobiota bacterium]